MALAGGYGENTARPWHRHRLAESKDKDCDRQPHQYVSKSKDMNEGRHDWNDNGVNPDVHHAGGVPVVVRGRESLLHGEGEQFKRLKCKLSDRIR